MCIVARFLTCRVEESRAGMEAEPLLCFPSTMYLDLSIRYVTLFSFWINNCLIPFLENEHYMVFKLKKAQSITRVTS